MSSAQDRSAGYPAGSPSAGDDSASYPPEAGSPPAGSPQAGYQPGYQDTAAGYGNGTGDGMAQAGFTVLAATLMILSGLWSFFVGLTAVIKQHFFVVLPNYTFHLNVHAWGWVHLALGILVFAAGVCLLLGQTWARVVGVVLAVISGIANFLFLPYYPVWSIVVIAIDLFIIWALVTGPGKRERV
jgi:hypothetical protein